MIKFTLWDIAYFIKNSNFNLSTEYEILNIIWEMRDEFFETNSFIDKYEFYRNVKEIILKKLESSKTEIQQIEIFFEELGVENSIDNLEFENDSVKNYLKSTKLKLLCKADIGHQRIKYRNFLKKIGLKKRNEIRLGKVIEILNLLELDIHLSRNRKCDLKNISLDETLFIKLKKSN